jgi:hypothetical protein
MTTSYQHTTLGDFKSALALRLGDTSKTHWLDDELGLMTIETIRLFNVLSFGYHRATVNFNTTTGTPLYDLTSVAIVVPSLRAYTVRDQDVIALLQYQFMEPKSVLAWTGSEMWTLAEVVSALQRRRDQFLADTACVVTPHSYPIGPVNFFDLPDSVTSIRRVVWRSSTGAPFNLFGSDETTFSINPQWRQSVSVPTLYSVVSSAPLRIQFNSTFPTSGTLDLLTVESGAVLNPAANANTGTVLGVPDDLAWGVRFGAMADLLRKEGPARDIVRADYCDAIYSMAVSLTNESSTVLAASIRDASVPIQSLAQLDALRRGWQGQNTSTPSVVATASMNLVAVYPLPDASYPVSLSIVRNAIVPSSSTDDSAYLQVSRDDLPGLLAWAECLAAFKSQGASLDSAKSASQLLLERASAFIGRRLSESSFGRNVFGFSRDDFSIRPLVSKSMTAQVSTQGTASDSSSSNAPDSASRHQSRGRSNATRGARRLGGR